MKKLIVPGVNPNHFPEVTEVADDVAHITINYQDETLTTNSGTQIAVVVQDDQVVASAQQANAKFLNDLAEGDVVTIAGEFRMVTEVTSDTQFRINEDLDNLATTSSALVLKQAKAIEIPQEANFARFSSDNSLSVKFDNFELDFASATAGVVYGPTFVIPSRGIVKKLSNKKILVIGADDQSGGTGIVEFFT